MLDHIPSPEDCTLRQRVETAIKLSRELDTHLRETLVPASQRVRRLAEGAPATSGRVGERAGDFQVAGDASEEPPGQRDVAVRHAVDSLLEADRFAAAKRAHLEDYCRSVREAVGRELTAGAG